MDKVKATVPLGTEKAICVDLAAARYLLLREPPEPWHEKTAGELRAKPSEQ